MVKVLVIDDDVGYLSVLRTFLTDRNYRVTTATNIRNGFKEFDEERPHVVLCDILLPGEKGYEFVRKVRKNNKNVLIIIISILQEFREIEEAYTCGADLYMSKPAHLKTLHKCIQIMLEVRKAGMG
jgi:DNA-binding response OmpR family regulator